MNAMQRPNILFITSDQQRGDCYGHQGRAVKTPHLDQLAAGGARFDLAITANPVCQPARASILTGQLPLTHGVCDNGIDLAPAVGESGFAGQLAGAGYATAFIGKAHFSTHQTFAPTGSPECRTSSADYGENWFGPYMGFAYAELMTIGHFYKLRPPVKPPHGQHFDRWFFGGAAGDAGYAMWERETRPGGGAAQTWNSALPLAWHSGTWVTDRALNCLRAHAEQTPFCMWVSYPDPHHPFDCPEPWCRLHHPDEVELPPHHQKDLQRRPWWHRASLENTPQTPDPVLKNFRAKGSRMPDQTDAQLREMTANYYGMIAHIDHGVGRLLAELEHLGLADDTLVFYTSDHGDLLGDHGLYLKGPTPYEGLLNVGIIARGPGVPAGKRVAEPVSTMDLAATFCDYGGAALPGEAQSASLRPLFENGAARDAAYCEWNLHPNRCGVELKLRTVRTQTAKLTLELVSGAGEFYDLKNDPNEMDNRFDDPGCAALQGELREMLKARPGGERAEFDTPVGSA